MLTGMIWLSKSYGMVIPQPVPSRDIVVGDLILLEAGDAVPADGWIRSADDIFTDESAFTGESEPVKKEVQQRVLKGTFVTAGKGQMIAAAVGDSAEMGVIASSLGIDHATQTPLEHKLEDLAGSSANSGMQWLFSYAVPCSSGALSLGM